MKETLQVINKMQADGVFGRYAIGGAIGATFYLEPTSTFDIDIFISFTSSPGSLLVSLDPIYTYLRSLNYQTQNEHIIIEGWPVQFLPADDALYNEALVQATETNFHGVKTWVMMAEHLMAIALKTGRRKDFIRIDQFLSSRRYDPLKLDKILGQHGLVEKWEQFNRKFGGAG